MLLITCIHQRQAHARKAIGLQDYFWFHAGFLQSDDEAAADVGDGPSENVHVLELPEGQRDTAVSEAFTLKPTVRIARAFVRSLPFFISSGRR